MSKINHVLHSQQSLIENFITGQTAAAHNIYSQMHNGHGIQHYAISSLLYIHAIKDKYIAIYHEFIFTITNICQGCKNIS